MTSDGGGARSLWRRARQRIDIARSRIDHSGFVWCVVRPVLFWLIVVMSVSALAQLFAGCTAVGEWLASPSAAPSVGPDGTATPAPTNGEVVVATGSSIIGIINPFAGYAAAAIGRLGLGAVMAKKGALTPPQGRIPG